VSKKKRKPEYTALGWVIQNPQMPKYYFMAWQINETGRIVIWSRAMIEYRIFKSEKEANTWNQELKGRIRRIEIRG